MGQKKNWTAKIISSMMLVLALGILLISLWNDTSAINKLENKIKEIEQNESYANDVKTWNFEGVFVQDMYRFEGENDEKIAYDDYVEFKSNSISNIFTKLCSSAALFSIVAIIFASCFICVFFPAKIKLIPQYALSVFALYWGALLITWLISEIGGLNLDKKMAIGIVCSVLSVITSSLLIKLFYQKIKIKILIPIILLIILVLGYIFGAISKDRIWSPKYISSFSYLQEIDERIFDEKYQDLITWNDNGNLIFEGVEYEPEFYPNEDHSTGVNFVGYCIAEMINPITGLFVSMMMLDDDLNIFPFFIYIIQGLFLVIIYVLLLKYKNKKD